MKQKGSDRTRFESCLAVLGALKRKTPSTLSEMQRKTALDGLTLKECLTFMVQQGVVTAANPDKPSEYTRTQKGPNVIRYFQSQQGLPQAENPTTQMQGSL